MERGSRGPLPRDPHNRLFKTGFYRVLPTTQHLVQNKTIPRSEYDGRIQSN